jgi:hypothetical protein
VAEAEDEDDAPEDAAPEDAAWPLTSPAPMTWRPPRPEPKP